MVKPQKLKPKEQIRGHVLHCGCCCFINHRPLKIQITFPINMLPLPNQKHTFPPRFQSSFFGNRVSVAIPSASHRFCIRFRFGVGNQSLSGDSMQHRCGRGYCWNCVCGQGKVHWQKTNTGKHCTCECSMWTR